MCVACWTSARQRTFLGCLFIHLEPSYDAHLGPEVIKEALHNVPELALDKCDMPGAAAASLSKLPSINLQSSVPELCLLVKFPSSE